MNTAENELQNAFDYMESAPKSTVYNPTDLRRKIKEARKQGVDVSVFEAKLPELDKRFAENELQDAFDHMESEPKSTVYNPTDLRRRIEKARKQGVSVSVFEAKLPELDKRFAENELRDAFDHMESKPKSTIYNPTDLRRRIEKARKQGVNVSVFEAKLPELDNRFAENE